MSCFCRSRNRQNGCYAQFYAPACNRTSPCMKTHQASVIGVENNSCCCCCGCGCANSCGNRRSLYGALTNPYSHSDRCDYDYAYDNPCEPCD